MLPLPGPNEVDTRVDYLASLRLQADLLSSAVNFQQNGRMTIVPLLHLVTLIL